jgi:hypothetical protein
VGPVDFTQALPWLRTEGTEQYVYLAGDWAGHSQYDGCIQDPPNPQPARMAYAVSMGGATPNTTAYFAGCDQEDIWGNFFFNETGDVAAGSIFTPTVQNASFTAPGNMRITLAPPDVGGGIFDGADCGGANSGVIRCGPGPGDFRVIKKPIRPQTE